MPNITVANTAKLLVVANANRKSLLITNWGPDPKGIWLGTGSGITAGTGPTGGLWLDIGGTIAEDSGGTRMFLGDIYAIGATTTQSAVSFWERE